MKLLLQNTINLNVMFEKKLKYLAFSLFFSGVLIFAKLDDLKAQIPCPEPFLRLKQIDPDFISIPNEVNLKSEYIKHFCKRVRYFSGIFTQLSEVIVTEISNDSIFYNDNYADYVNIRYAHDHGKLKIDSSFLAFHHSLTPLVRSIDSLYCDTLKIQFLVNDNNNDVFVSESAVYQSGDKYFLRKKIIHREYIENLAEQNFDFSLDSLFNCFEFESGAYGYENHAFDVYKLVAKHAICITYKYKYYFFTSSYSNVLVSYSKAYGII